MVNVIWRNNLFWIKMKPVRGKFFGTAGIRGVFNREITFELVFRLAYALTSFKRYGEVTIARDGRLGGEAIKNELRSAFIASSWNVYDLNAAVTPLLAFATRELSDFGVMVTASHNPPQYVGMKVFCENGMELPMNLEDKIEERMRKYCSPSINSVSYTHLTLPTN